MMMLLGTYVRRWHRILRRWMSRPELRLPLQAAVCFAAGFGVSAASLGNLPQPFGLGILCAGLEGWLPLPFALGSVLGSWVFWGTAGISGIIWTAAALPVCILLGQKKARLSMPLLQPALAALIVAVSGVIFQLWKGDDTPVPMYLLRIGLAFGTTWLVASFTEHRDAASEWVLTAIGVLALAQIVPLPFLGLGYVAGAALVTRAPFPAVALAGLALDLAQVTPVPMTAVLCLSYMLRLIPGMPRFWVGCGSALVYALVMGICGRMDLLPLPGLLVGGAVGLLLPGIPQLSHRRGETGFAQVRLELASGVLAQSEQLLLEAQTHPIDEQALIRKAAERACSSCPARKGCKDLEQAKTMPESLLHRPLTVAEDLPVSCKKRGRLMLELRRSQDQYRTLKADRDRQQEYRGAVIQQYRFLSEYLQSLADQLPQRGGGNRQRFQPEVAVCTSGKELTNGDRCLWFAGTGCRYYLLLCDGMGTGEAAAEEAKQAAEMLRRLLMAGFPAQYALRSLNSLCTLRGRAAAVTVDLAEIHLESGKASLFKWGAAPSWLLVNTGPERIGSFSAPPGLSVTDVRETVDTLTLRRGETLVLLSDGVDPEKALKIMNDMLEESPGALTSKILESSHSDDDATAAAVRLNPLSTAS